MAATTCVDLWALYNQCFGPPFGPNSRGIKPGNEVQRLLLRTSGTLTIRPKALTLGGFLRFMPRDTLFETAMSIPQKKRTVQEKTVSKVAPRGHACIGTQSARSLSLKEAISVRTIAGNRRPTIITASDIESLHLNGRC